MQAISMQWPERGGIWHSRLWSIGVGGASLSPLFSAVRLRAKRSFHRALYTIADSLPHALPTPTLSSGSWARGAEVYF
ncbi:hypothetical protein DPEC_G00280070 [Dallia pectoralis]|uniref:Uncharacterized protein n=1 Tax=Dallia pectoralis TaxID=75939 RepID=A0ACC2FME2_DALPE|nr:hypothetical protein DPEC_G00280070 [Dallia pectoralis]